MHFFPAMTLSSVGEEPSEDPKGKSISEIGSMLFTRGVSGTRVITGKDTKVIEGYTFKGKNMHYFCKKNTPRLVDPTVKYQLISRLSPRPTKFKASNFPQKLIKM